MSTARLVDGKQHPTVGVSQDRTALLIRAALQYAANGWPVFPLHWVNEHGKCACSRDCGRDAGNHPLWHKKDLPHGHLNATTDAEQITACWNRWPAANIGIPTGHKANLVVLDVDPRNDGDTTYHELEKERKFPKTWMALPGGGSWHEYFSTGTGISLDSRKGMWPGTSKRTVGVW